MQTLLSMKLVSTFVKPNKSLNKKDTIWFIILALTPHPISMKKLSLLCLMAFSAYFAKSQTLILAKDAAQHLNKTVTICDSVYSTKTLDKISLINLGGAFPNELITVVIHKEDQSKFTSAPASMFLGNNICVTGIISEFKGKRQIVVTDPKQIIVK